MRRSPASSLERLTTLVSILVLLAAFALGPISEEVAVGLNKPGRWVPDLLVGMVLVGAGLVAVRLDRGTGWLLVASGFAWWLGNIFPPLLYLHRGLLFHAVATYPGGRATRPGAVLLAVAYLGASVPALAATGVGTGGYGLAVTAVALSRLRGVAGQTLRYRVFALYASIAILVGTTLVTPIRMLLDQNRLAESALLVYQASLAAAAILLALGLRLPPPDTIADLVIDLDETRSPSLRDTLARLLGDPLLQIGSSDGDGGFVDSEGRRILLPDEESGRVATLLEREKGETAVIVHDRTLASDGVLLEAVATVARLSTSNTRLNAEARARLTELTASRRRLLLAEEGERQRLSFRLQDRTDPGLASIELTLTSIVQDPETPASVVRLVDPAIDQLHLARDDLADIVRGLHPWEVDGDLSRALTALASRTPIPVHVDVSGDPVDREVATAVYYVCAEAVTNALKHAAAARVQIEVHGTGSDLIVTVSDDGAGGADPARGSGLRGLVDRVAALGGELEVDSPPGRGTTLVGTLPRRVVG